MPTIGKLTDRQKTFAKFIVEGIYSNTECARKSGYSPNVAKKQASVLLNGKDYPHVVDYIVELREEKERLNAFRYNTNNVIS